MLKLEVGDDAWVARCSICKSILRPVVSGSVTLLLVQDDVLLDLLGFGRLLDVLELALRLFLPGVGLVIGAL